MEPRRVCFVRDAWVRIHARVHASAAIWVDSSLLRTLFMHAMCTLFVSYERCECAGSQWCPRVWQRAQALVGTSMGLGQCVGSMGPIENRVMQNTVPLFLTRVGGGSHITLHMYAESRRGDQDPLGRAY